MANTSETRLAYVAESTWGTTPATPAFQISRFTGEGLTPSINTTTSEELRQDRNITDLIQTGQTAGGNVDFELSFGAIDDLLESVLYSTWVSDVIKNGVTEKSFTLEKTFETGSTDQFHRLAGSVADTLSLDLQVGNVATGSFGFLSKGLDAAQTQITGATYTAAPSNDVISTASGFGSLAITGATNAMLTQLQIEISNNLAHQQQLGSLDARGIRSGRFEVSGSLTAYFESKELYDLFLSGSAADLSFKLGGTSAKNYVFDIPNLKFSDGSVVAGGNDQDLLVNLSFTGLYDANDDATIKITRTV